MAGKSPNIKNSPILEMYRRYFRPYRAVLLAACLCYLFVAAESSMVAGISRYLVDNVLEVDLIRKPVLTGEPKEFVRSPQIPYIEDDAPLLLRPESVDEARIADKSSEFQPILLDRVADNGGLEDRIEARKGKSAWQKTKLLGLIVLMLVGVRLFVLCLRSWADFKIGKITEEAVFRIRRHLYDKLLRLHLGFHEQNNTGKLLTRATEDIFILQHHFAPLLTHWIMFVGLLVINISLMFYIHARFTVLILLALPFYVIAYNTLRTKLRRNVDLQRREIASIYGLIRDRLAYPRVVRGFGVEKREILNFFKKIRRHFTLSMKIVVLNNLLTMICTCISVVVSAIVLWYGTILVRRGELSLGYLLFFYSVSYSLFWPLAALTQTTFVAQRVNLACDKILGILKEPFEIKERHDGKILDRIEKEIVLENVSFKYPGSDNYVLRDISVRIPVGKKICLMGSSGAGKSTLGAIILRLYDPQEGRVLIDQTDLRDFRISSIRKKISYVPQEPLLFSGTIRSNITYGNNTATMEEIRRAARLAEIDEFIESLPQKYETVIGENGLRLSGGQRQRISLARALLVDPEVLILDDFTSALDAATEASIHRSVNNALPGKTVIMITHRLSLARKADLILVLDKGRLVQVGTHEELVKQKGPYWELIKDQIDHGEVQRIKRIRDSQFAAA